MPYRSRMTKPHCAICGNRYGNRFSAAVPFRNGCNKRCFRWPRLEHFAAFSRHSASVQTRLSPVILFSRTSCESDTQHDVRRYARCRASARSLRDRRSPSDPRQRVGPAGGTFLETEWRDFRCNGRHLATPICVSASKSRCTSRIDKKRGPRDAALLSETAVPS